ncbi:MAG: adenosine nucleotide hydrolase, partial [Deltaproteobacteria bacterium]|nr:adenosine nucleotide hydrolase [Deltaproteobacteria bacterium]
MNTINNKKFFCSWSGGKDSCLALFEAIQMGGIPKALVTMMIEDNKRSRSHGLPVEVLKKQAESLNIPLYVYSTSWENYEDVFKGAIRSLKEEGVEWGVFGDIDLEPHLEWVERVCNSENVTAFEPLWKKKRMDLLTRFIDLDFSTTVISIKEEKLKRSFL